MALELAIEGQPAQVSTLKRGEIYLDLMNHSFCRCGNEVPSAADAASKFRYAPRILDGNTIPVENVKNRFTFTRQ